MTKLLGKRWTLAAILVPVLGTGMAGFLAAQAARPAQTAPNQAAPRQPGQAGRHENLDHYFAACLILDNDNEIQAAKLAKDKAEDAEVKKFASMMQSDHEKFIKDLEQFGGGEVRARRADHRADAGGARPTAGAAAADNTGRNTARHETTPQPQAGQPRAAAGGAHENIHDSFLQIREEIADQCLASARRELDGKSGKEFDECYMGMQLGAHMHMIDALVVLERHATSPELQKVLRKGQETAQMHFDRAKKIMKDLTGDHATTARSDKSTGKD